MKREIELAPLGCVSYVVSLVLATGSWWIDWTPGYILAAAAFVAGITFLALGALGGE